VLTKRFCSVLQLAEKYFVKGGDPRAAIEMYTKANMYEAAHKVTLLDSSHCLHFVLQKCCYYNLLPALTSCF